MPVCATAQFQANAQFDRLTTSDSVDPFVQMLPKDERKHQEFLHQNNLSYQDDQAK
jgi:hypothetical protein